MSERDLELGSLSSRPSNISYDADAAASQSSIGSDTLWTSSYGRADLGKDGLTAIPEAEARNASDEAQEVEDGGYVTLPRRKVEELMGLWINVLQQSLQADNRQKPLHPLVSQPKLRDRSRLSSYAFGQYPPILRSRDEQPWCTVEPMTEAQIKAENGYRRLRRAEWTTSDQAVDSEDCWRCLWEPSTGVDKGLFQWPCSEETRRALQMELADAFIGNDRIVTVNMYMQRDHRTISPWISLIGLRLNEQYRSYRRHPDVGPIVQIRVLIECIWACNAFDPNINPKQGYREGPRLSNVLSACYRRGILHRPEKGFDNYVTKTYLQRQCQTVRRALHLISLLKEHYIGMYVPMADLRATQDVWDVPLPDVEAPAATTQLTHRISELREAPEVFLRIDDFNLRDLQTLGHLQIHWTSYWDEHLQLETSLTANILKIFWFQPKLGRYLVEKYPSPPILSKPATPSLTPTHSHLSTYTTSADLTRREDEIYRTWCLIFTSKTTPRTSLSRYRSLTAPRWLSLLGHPRLHTWTAEQTTNSSPDAGPPISTFTPSSSSSLQDYCFELSDHLLLRWSPDGKLPHERISYAQFPIYAERLRELRAFMDSQQPKGLRALWKDRRNSNTYYTFWFVTIFGTCSVFLATCALAVGIAQTWAAFKQLGP